MRKKTRYIVIDKDMGVFLGTYHGEDLGAEDGKMYACFASHNPFGLTTACSFPNEAIARHYIKDTFAPYRRTNLTIAPVKTDTEYPDVVDIIKAGYGDFTYTMLDNMFEEGCQTIH